MPDTVRVRFSHNGKQYRARIPKSELKKDGTPKVSAIRRIDRQRQERAARPG